MSIIDRKNISKFDTTFLEYIKLPLLRKNTFKLMAEELCSVQPMADLFKQYEEIEFIKDQEFRV